MEELPRERPVTEGGAEDVSPEQLERLKSLVKEQYKMRPAWRRVFPQLRPPTHKQMRHMIDDQKRAAVLHGAKILYLDDGPQCHPEFVTRLILVSRRRVERIFYHGESLEQIVEFFRTRLRRCPSPHLLILDGNLEMLPSLEPADHIVYGYDVLRHLAGDLSGAGVPAIGFSSDAKLHRQFGEAGADGFVRKTIPSLSAVEEVAALYQKALERIRSRRDWGFIEQD
ncbi:MAG: hypothetical protein PHS73_02830 [Candidatus Peribacteraceae bacterium]|nr:hypothetical protein [Candidatus Peribacteraceae bacterium]